MTSTTTDVSCVLHFDYLITFIFHSLTLRRCACHLQLSGGESEPEQPSKVHRRGDVVLLSLVQQSVQSDAATGAATRPNRSVVCVIASTV